MITDEHSIRRSVCGLEHASAPRGSPAFFTLHSAPLPPPGGISSEGKTARAAKFGERERFPVNYRYGKSSPHRCGAVQTWSSTGRTRGRERSVPPPPRGDRERRPSARRAPRQVENIDFSCGRREASERSGGGVTIGGLRCLRSSPAAPPPLAAA
ncbi:Hypothetical protein NTJ_03215 [Nesidiocoris tenuis]|uniref:Uncharacterized protein n=1 Tax=Nesidiocoris tenuis TaxID=355587 RepID=A0ABN7AGL3_9HEMI|nr:Hypothetical protein NTJ_03215 [Nesidiocoris tenuis]